MSRQKRKAQKGSGNAGADTGALRVARPPFLRRLAVPALLLAAVFTAHWPALTGGFLWDDEYATIRNRFLYEPGGLWRIWSTIGQISGEEHYWPMTYTVLWLEYRCWGGAAFGYHLVNFLLQGAVAIQIWRLMRRTGLPGAAIGATLFALHPVHTEAVAWIISVKDLLSTLFYLVAAEGFLNFSERGRWAHLLPAVLAAAAAMLSKATPVTLPCALAVWVWYRSGKIKPREAAGIAAIAATTFGLALFDVWVVKRIALPLPVPPFPERLIASGRSFWFYAEKLACPVGLSTIYPPWRLSARQWVDWLPLVAMGLVTAGLWLARRRIGRGPLACWLFYAITLGPALGIVYFFFLSTSPVADRYQYLASLGPLVGLGVLLGRWLGGIAPGRRAWARAAVWMLPAAMGVMTFREAACYRDLETLFARSTLRAPDSPVNRYNLGSGYLKNGKDDAAEREFREALRLKPDYIDAWSDLGGVLMKRNRTRAAAEVYREAVSQGYVTAELLNNYAWILATSPDATLANPSLALQYAEKSLTMKRDAKTLNSLAAAQAANRQTALAARTAREGLALATAAGDQGMIRTFNRLIPLYDEGRPVVDASSAETP